MDSYKKIAGLMLDEMKEPLAEKDISVSYDENALAKIAEKAHSQKFGARDIRKVIRKEVEDKVASVIIDNPVGSIKEIKITAPSDNIEVETIMR